MSLELHRPVRIAEPVRDEYLAFALELACDAGERILPWFRNDVDVSNKASDGSYDPVTEADRSAEVLIEARIAERYPEHGIYGEELGHRTGNGLTWVVDPIDGTRAFMTGMLHWGILIALFDGERPVLGVMHQPFTGELFWGAGGRAEYRHGTVSRRLRVRPCAGLDTAVLASTGPQFFAAGAEFRAFQAVADAVRLTRFGGDCYLYCMLASGHLDLAVEAGLKPYDIQALIPIIEGAGGIVTCWDGSSPVLGGRIIAAGDRRVHDQARLALESVLPGPGS
jgi:histidinol phosphatase-like enzyme (inositol monophosphatase family)